MKKVLVLGVSGMLGSMVFDYLSKNTKHEVRGTARSLDFPNVDKIKDKISLFDAEKDIVDKKIFLDYGPDYIINCVGIIKPYCKDNDEAGIIKAIKVNALFPHKLAEISKECGARVIQIATDCVYSGKKGGYLEDDEHDPLDVYGKTKSLGEAKREVFFNIRCSIVGPELKGKLSLLEWFLNQPESIQLKGFEHHLWNGVTTLQFSELCKQIIDSGEEKFDELVKISKVHHYIPNSTVNKFELLNIFKRVFGKKNTIEKVDNVGPSIDRTIGSKLHGLIREDVAGKKDTEIAIKELKDYMDVSYFK